MLVSAMGWVISGILLIIVGLLIRIPYILQDKLKGDRNNKSNHELQIESYFKQLGGTKQKDLLENWCNYITINYSDPNYEKEHDFKNQMFLTNQILIYGSEKTNKLLAGLNHYVNLLGNSQKDKKQYTFNDSKISVYKIMILSSLKNDFTGYDIDLDTFFKILINNYDSNIEEIDRIEKEIEKEIS